jgi:hypothetical protein
LDIKSQRILLPCFSSKFTPRRLLMENFVQIGGVEPLLGRIPFGFSGGVTGK